MKRSILIMTLMICIQGIFAQNKYSISGSVRDKKTGEVMIGAAVIVKDNAELGTITNAYGFFSLSVPEGKYTFAFHYTGYEEFDTIIDLHKNVKMDIEIAERVVDLHTFVFSSEAANKNVTSPEMSVQKINVKEIATIPVFLGERDILKTIQLLPGIKGVTEGNSGFYVRGGGIDQNLILLDEANVYNPAHLLGFFSIFNSDAIKDVTIYKGGIPAQYGGRISSVLDIKMNDGDNKEFKVTGGIGIIATRLTFEGPIKKGKGSFIISGRRTYADLFLKAFGPSNLKNTQLYFYDFNVKANYELGKKDRIYLSGYFGRDAFNFNNSTSTNQNFGINWGNTTATLRENHIFTDKLFLNSSLVYADYSNNISLGAGDAQFQVVTGIRDVSWKEAFEYYVSNTNTLRFGTEDIFHTFRPGEVTINTASTVLPRTLLRNTIGRKYGLESGIYISDEWKVSKKVTFNYGLRYSMFSDLGPATTYTYDSSLNVIDSATYKNNQIIKTYGGIEPRASIVFVLNDKSSIKASYNRIYQYIQLLSNSTVQTPVDLWVPSSNNIKPQIGDQEAVGYFRNFKNNMYETSVELYYKNMQNQIDYIPGANLLFNKQLESQLLYGRGYAYGAEFFVKKRYGRFNGWIGYTFSRTMRVFPGIDDGTPYPAKQDIVHDVSVVGMYEINKKWSLSSTFVYYTGYAVTFPSGKYQINGVVYSEYTDRNGYRMPAYNRLDIGATYTIVKTEKKECSWNFSVYNVYARENAFSIYFQQDPNDPTKTQAVQLSLFRFVPAITYNFKF